LRVALGDEGQHGRVPAAGHEDGIRAGRRVAARAGRVAGAGQALVADPARPAADLGPDALGGPGLAQDPAELAVGRDHQQPEGQQQRPLRDDEEQRDPHHDTIPGSGFWRAGTWPAARFPAAELAAGWWPA